MNVNFEFFDDEEAKIMEAFLLLDELFDLKEPKPPNRKGNSGKSHFYIETKDHKKRTSQRANIKMND